MPDANADDAVRRWAASGCMYLTGPADSPGLGPPAPLVPALDRLAERIRPASALIGTEVAVDPLALLAARGAIAQFRRRGRVSCGGGTRLLPTLDGWVALSLARDDDIAAVPALIEGDAGIDPWQAVETWVARRTGSVVVERGVLLGLPIAELPRCGSRPDAGIVEEVIDGSAIVGKPEITVVDLSSLWAGPLCGAILRMAGCRVIKVESTRRPDGARWGPRPFFDLLNGGKESVALDLAAPAGAASLRRILEGADVVIEASRPRVMHNLGIDPRELMTSGPRVWVSITAHGARGEAAHRVGFGDDAAVGGGLVVGNDNGPWFCADAIADPLTGLTAAASVLDALARRRRVHIDAAMARIAAHVAGQTLDVPASVTAAPPRPPAAAMRAADLGADTERVLADLGVS